MIAVAVQRRENGTRGEAAGCGKTGRKRKRGLVLPIMVLVSGLLAEEAPALVPLSRVAFFFFFFALLLLFKLVCNAYFACICGGIFCRGGYQCSVSLERQMAASRIALFTDGWE